MKEKKTCAVGDCQLPSRRYGYCQKHSYRYMKYGDPLFTKYRTGSLADRLKGSIDTSGGEGACHLWTGDCNEAGYGVIRFQGKYYIVTRAVMTVELGRELDSEEWVLHTCDNPPVLQQEALVHRGSEAECFGPEGARKALAGSPAAENPLQAGPRIHPGKHLHDQDWTILHSMQEGDHSCPLLSQ
jgi:hypothetical protein